MYYNFLHADPYINAQEKEKKEKKTKHIYIAHTHTQLLTDKKKTPQYILLHLREKIIK